MHQTSKMKTLAVLAVLVVLVNVASCFNCRCVLGNEHPQDKFCTSDYGKITLSLIYCCDLGRCCCVLLLSVDGRRSPSGNECYMK